MSARKTPRKRAPKPVAYPRPGHALVLRSCNAQMQGYGGFVWPASGLVEAPDWTPEKKCGGGLHGWLWGRGDGSLGCQDEDARWLVVEVEESSIVDLDGKVKFPRGEVLFVGDSSGATAWLAARSGRDGIVRGTATAGYGGTATAGYGGTATAGAEGVATAGVGGVATAGAEGVATAGVGGVATAGYKGVAIAGYKGVATAGTEGVATAGEWGTATAGDGGTATAGDGGVATAGAEGVATAGEWGTATAGVGGEVRIRWWDPRSGRYRVAVGYVGEDGIEPATAYVCDDEGRLMRKVQP